MTNPVSGVVPNGNGERRERQRRFGFLGELPGVILVAFLLALLIKSLLVQAFFIPSGSMEHTLQIGDRVLVNKIVYHFREPRRGDVVVFRNPGHAENDGTVFEDLWNWITEGLGVASDPEKDFIKRIIAVPGETFEYRSGRVFIDGKRLKEPYLHPVADSNHDVEPVTIPADSYWVMGDNRTNSEDSRRFGPIPREKVVGRAFVILWPPSRAGWLGGQPGSS